MGYIHKRENSKLNRRKSLRKNMKKKKENIYKNKKNKNSFFFVTSNYDYYGSAI